MTVALHDRATGESHVLFSAAIGHMTSNRHREALVHLAGALRISPDHPEYVSHFAVCLAHVESDFERAVALCRQTLVAGPRNPALHVNLGRVYRLQGDNRAAYQQFQRAWRLDRRHPATASELARMGIRRPPFVRFLRRDHWMNIQLGRLRAMLERRLVGRRLL